MIAEKDFAGRQSRGTRVAQEDACAFSEITGTAANDKGVLAVVADGMGGHAAGDLASALALGGFISAFQDATGAISKRLSMALTAANDAIAAELQRQRACEGMGTTLLAVCITPAGIEWISVGDSPLYLWNNGVLERLNEDHSLRPVVEEMAKEGRISETDPSRNILRSALIGDEIAMIDRSDAAKPLPAHALVIATTDGIHTLTEDQISRVCADADGIAASEIVSRLLEAVKRAGNPRQDNTTVAVVRSTSPLS